MKKFFSFRFKMTIVLLVVIVSISFVSFFLYNRYLTKKIYSNAEENIVSILHLVKDQYYLSKHDTSSTFNILKKIEEHNWVLKTCLANSKGNILYTSKAKYPLCEIPDTKKLLSLTKEVTLESHIYNNEPYTRIYMKMENSPSCYECHSSEIKTIGYLVYDISMTGAEKNKVFLLKFTLFNTIFLVLIIGLVISLMHYKFVRKSLMHFQIKIEKINRGNLDERIVIPHTKELGQLGEHFNKMLDKFQKTRKELLFCHKKELRNNKKLATVGEMAARLAHEIRNPITGIANAIEIIADEIPDKQNRPILEEIQRQANRVNDAISKLLIYSRASELDTKDCNINELVKSLAFFLKNQNHNKRIKFLADLEDDIPNFYIDQGKIENALLNLGLNAVQAIKKQGIVTFKTNYDAAKNIIMVNVQDTGSGISNEILPKIFSPFFTTRTEGTGLGLAIVKDIVEKHQGKIWVEKNIKKGSVFTILLPIIEKEELINI
ncbi:MAG: ATP-binding protein [Bacteroidota bacterium]